MSQAVISNFVVGHERKNLASFMTVLLGCALLSALAQISLRLPFTPVPITGQTFGVALISLLMGKRLAFFTIAFYLFVGAAGLPVFAGATSGFALAPSSGYLVGMLAASFVMGILTDKGWARSFWKAYLTCAIGSALTFTVGAWVLSFFVPNENIFIIGVLPFLPGDLLKSIAASLIASDISRRQK